MPTPNNPFDYDPLNDPQIAMMLAQLSQRGIAQRDAAFNAANAPRQPDTRDRNPFADMNAVAIGRARRDQAGLQTERMGMARDADALSLDSAAMRNAQQRQGLMRDRSVGNSAQSVLDFQNRAMVQRGRAQGEAMGDAQRMQRQARGAPRDRIEDTYANAFLDRLLGAGGSMTTQRQVPGYEMDTGMRGPDGEVLMQRVPGRTEEVTEQIGPRGLGDTGSLPENLRAAFEPGYQDPTARRQGAVAEDLAGDLMARIEEARRKKIPVADVLQDADAATLAAALGPDAAMAILESRRLDNEIEHRRKVEEIVRTGTERNRDNARRVPVTNALAGNYDSQIEKIVKSRPRQQTVPRQTGGNTAEVQRIRQANEAAAAEHFEMRVIPALEAKYNEIAEMHGEAAARQYIADAIPRVGRGVLTPEQITALVSAITGGTDNG